MKGEKIKLSEVLGSIVSQSCVDSIDNDTIFTGW
jgi:hypothetical protein